MRYIVAGSPCAGKTSYVKNRYKSGDLIYDYDTLHGALSGRESHQHLDEIKPFLLGARYGAFGKLDARKTQAAWIITSTKSAETLREMAKRFEAEIIFLEISREEAHRRCDLSGRPQVWHEYIDRWFNEADIDPSEFRKSKSSLVGG